MTTFSIATSTKTCLIGDLRVPVDTLPKYTLMFGYEHSAAITKIKDLIKDIKSGDFTVSTHDSATPTGLAKTERGFYAALKGRKLERFLETDHHIAYHAIGFVPNQSVAIVERNQWVKPNGRPYSCVHTAYHQTTLDQLKTSIIAWETNAYHHVTLPHGGKRSTTLEEKAAFVWTDLTRITRQSAWYVTVEDGPLYGSHDIHGNGCTFGLAECRTHEEAVIARDRLVTRLGL